MNSLTVVSVCLHFYMSHLLISVEYNLSDRRRRFQSKCIAIAAIERTQILE